MSQGWVSAVPLGIHSPHPSPEVQCRQHCIPVGTAWSSFDVHEDERLPVEIMSNGMTLGGMSTSSIFNSTPLLRELGNISLWGSLASLMYFLCIPDVPRGSDCSQHTTKKPDVVIWETFTLSQY